MSTQPLVPPDEALPLSFPELARNIRENLDEVKANQSHRLDADVLRKLMSLLDDKLHGASTKIPPKPQSPRAPIQPSVPRKLPKLRNPRTPEYEQCRLEFDERIGALRSQALQCPAEERAPLNRHVNTLQQEQKMKLAGIVLSYETPEFRDEWNTILAERASYNHRILQYDKLVREYRNTERSILAARAQWDLRYGKLSGSSEMRKRIYDHLKVDVAAYLRGDWSFAVERLPWRFLPPGPDGIAHVANEIRELKMRCPHLHYDEKRLEYAQTLNPSHTYVGNDEFEGYFAFVFDRTEHVLLENPQEGNAAYIFKRNWTALSRLPKRDLLEDYQDDVQRVLHRDTGNWKWRIRRALHMR